MVEAHAPKRLLIVLGEGGHTKQMLRLVELLGPGYEYHYVINRGDELSGRKLPFSGRTYTLIRPRAKQRGQTDPFLKATWQTVASIFQAWGVVRRIHPLAVIGAGPSICVPVSLVAKLYRAKIIHIETASRIHRPSLTGRIMYRLADLFFIQWETLRPYFPRAIYAGRLW